MRAVADIGSHWLDLTRFITGQDVSEVAPISPRSCQFARSRWCHWRPLPARNCNRTNTKSAKFGPRITRACSFDSPAARSGVLTVSQVSAGRKNHNAFEINGSNGSIAWDSERVEELWIGHRDRPSELLLKDPTTMSAWGRAASEAPGGHAEGFRDTFKMLYRRVYPRSRREGHRPSRITRPSRTASTP